MRLLRLFIFFLFCLTVSIPAYSQEQQAESQQETPKRPSPYDISHISEAVEMTDVVLRYCRDLTNDSAVMANFDKEFETIINKYNKDHLDSIDVDFSELNIWSLKDKKAYWEDLKGQWTNYSLKVKERADENRLATDSLKRVENKWLVTKAMVDTLEQAESVSETIENSIQSTAVLGENLKTKLASVLDIEARTSKQILIVNDVLGQIDNLITERGQNLFQKDSEPFFKALKHRNRDEEGFVRAVYGSVKEAVDDIVEFAEDNFWSVFYQLLSLVILYFLMIFINRKFIVSDLYEDKDLAVVRKVLNQPFVSTFILTLISSQLFYGRMPMMVRDLLLVLTIIPIAVLLPKILNQRLRYFVVFLFILLVLDKIQGLLPAGHINQRILVGVLSIFAFTGFAFALRRKSELNKAIRENGRMIVIRIIQLYTLLMAGAIVTNIVGVFGLSRLVTSGVILSFVLGVIIFLAASILKAVILFVVRSGLAGKLNLLKKYNKEVERWAFVIINIYGIWLWFKAFLRGFALRNYAEEQLDKFLATTWKFGEISLSVENLVDFVVILAIFYVIANVLHLILKEEVLKRFDMRRGITLAISILTRYVILLLGFVLAMSSAGISLSKLSLLIGALGVGIGFGLQSIVGNFVSGLVIIFERPIHIGDIVSTATIEGEVIEIGLRSSRIRTWEGAEVIVPNMNLTVNEVTNWTFSDRKRRKEIFVLIENGPSPRDVKSVIDNVLQSHDGLLNDPEPQAYFLGYEGNSLKFRLLIWLSDNILMTPSEVMLNLHDALQANGYKPYIPIQKLLVTKNESNDEIMPIIGQPKVVKDDKPEKGITGEGEKDS